MTNTPKPDMQPNQERPLERYVRLAVAADGQYYPEYVESYDDPEFCIEPQIDVLECGPALGNASLPADVRAARWAAKRGWQYRG